MVPELPEIQAHAERLTQGWAGRELAGFRPITFTALKTAVPRPDEAVGRPLDDNPRLGDHRDDPGVGRPVARPVVAEVDPRAGLE